MKVLRFLLIALFFWGLFMQAGGQQLREDEIVMMQGEKFVLHQVRTGETIFSISKKFKIEQAQLLQHNPQISQGLNIGQILKIPYHDDVVLENAAPFQKGDPTGFIQHKVTSRTETPYFIAKEYGITVEEIYAYNPEMKRIKKGMTLRIPRWEPVVEQTRTATAEQPDAPEMQKQTNEPIEHTVLPGETLYSISRKYGVTEAEILFFNPGAKNLRAGAKISLPGSSTSKQDRVVLPQPLDEVTDDFQLHTIVSGETLWRVAHQYGVTEQQLVALNPVLKTAFPAGVVIKIPRQQTASQGLPNAESKVAEPLSEVPKSQAENTTNLYQPLPETAQADRSEHSIKLLEAEPVLTIPGSCVPVDHRMFTNQRYDIALFLPLFLEANDTINRQKEITIADSLAILDNEVAEETTEGIELDEPVERFREFYGSSENFLQFYEGVIIAIDSMKKAGMKIRLQVFDTRNSIAAVRQAMVRDDFLETDLIIGPVYPEVQEEVARVAAKNRIPLISPFSSNSALVNSNPYVYQINPTREYIAEKTAELVAEEYANSNFVVVQTSSYAGKPEEALVNKFRQQMDYSRGGKFTVYDFQNRGKAGLKSLMSAEKENVVFIPTSVEGELSIALSNINNLADEFSITLIGASNYQQRYPSIDVAQFHNLKFKYLNPFWMDYDNPATVRFIQKFKANFATEPNNFGVQGFDAAFYFLNALNYYGKDFNACIPYLHVNLVQGNYHFEKVSPFGGYMNKGVSVVNYYRNYTVRRERIKGQPRLAAE